MDLPSPTDAKFRDPETCKKASIHRAFCYAKPAKSPTRFPEDPYNQSAIISVLRKHQEEIRAFGASSVYLYPGSVTPIQAMVVLPIRFLTVGADGRKSKIAQAAHFAGRYCPGV